MSAMFGAATIIAVQTAHGVLKVCPDMAIMCVYAFMSVWLAVPTQAATAWRAGPTLPSLRIIDSRICYKYVLKCLSVPRSAFSLGLLSITEAKYRMVHHDVVLPPCVYPAAKPYAGFTTLVHRYGRYDRICTSLIDDCSIDTCSYSSGASSSPSGSPRLELHETEVQTLTRTRSVGGAMVTRRDMTRAIEAISYQLNKPSMREYQDQRVVLSPKKEIKLELARMGSAVEKFYRSN